MEQNLTIEQLKFAREIGAVYRVNSILGSEITDGVLGKDGFVYRNGWLPWVSKGTSLEYDTVSNPCSRSYIDFTPLDELEASQKQIPPPDYNPADVAFKSTSDGSTASYYQLPPECTELQDLISYRNMNAQDGEIFRAIYRKGRASHSDALRDAKKVLFYAQAEVDRLQRYME